MNLRNSIRNRRGTIAGAIGGYLLLKFIGWLTRRLFAGMGQQQTGSGPTSAG